MNTLERRESIEHLRNIHPALILRAVEASPDPHDPAKWHTHRGTVSVNGAKFFNWNEDTGGGGAIDLAMHLNGMRFKDAIEWLARRFAPQPTLPTIDQSHISRRLLLPAPVADAWPIVLRYLDEQRRLPRQRLLSLAGRGDLYADRKHNAVFIMRNEYNRTVGAELRGTGLNQWRGMAPGSHKNHGYFAIGPRQPNAIVLCESAIDAISCHTINPRQRCISTSGARANPTWLPKLFDQNITVYCGFDNDPAGDAMASAMIAQYPAVQRIRPPAQDWNDALRM